MANNYSVIGYRLFFGKHATEETGPECLKESNRFQFDGEAWCAIWEEYNDSLGEILSSVFPDNETFLHYEQVFDLDEDEGKMYDAEEALRDIESSPDWWLEALKPYGCKEVEIFHQYSCDKPRPMEFGIHWQAARLGENGQLQLAHFGDREDLYKDYVKPTE